MDGPPKELIRGNSQNLPEPLTPLPICSSDPEPTVDRDSPPNRHGRRDKLLSHVENFLLPL